MYFSIFINQNIYSVGRSDRKRPITSKISEKIMISFYGLSGMGGNGVVL
jgi:hypothetical protein